MSVLGDMQTFFSDSVKSYGLFGLFIAMVLGGTVLPVSCDAFAVLALGLGMPLFPVILVSAIGITVGSMSTFYIGKAGSNKLQKKMSKEKLEKYQGIFQKEHGSFLIFFAALTPLPFDPCAVVAGSLRMSTLRFFISNFVGRFLRYVLLLTYVKYAIMGGSSVHSGVFLAIGIAILIAITFLSFIVWRKMGFRENTIIDRALDKLENYFGGYQEIQKKRSDRYKEVFEKGKKLREEMREENET